MSKVHQYIEANKEKYLGWLEKVCNQPSVSAQNRGMEEMFTILKELLQRVGAQTKTIQTEGYPVLIGEFQGEKEETLAFYNHYDVQPEDPLDEWESEPFQTTFRNGVVFARGTADNKGNIIARLAAVDAYQVVHGKLPIHIKFIIEGEEEVGSPHLEYLAREHTEDIRADAILWEGGMREVNNKRLHVGLGVKGIAYVELISKGAKHDLHSSEAAIIENPAWKLTWALSTLKDRNDNVLIDHFYDEVKPLTDKSKQFIETLEYDETYTKENYEIDEFIDGISGYELKRRLIAEPTCTICGIKSGYIEEGAKTVLPSKAVAKLDFRLIPGQKPDRIVSLLRKHLDKHGFEDIEINQLNHLESYNTDPDDPFVTQVLDAVAETYEEEAIIYSNLAGSSPMHKLLSNCPMPAVQVGVANTSSKFHAPNENITIQDFIQGTQLVATIINKFKK
ncbi:M20/M25/M40 family metallo-hydrolase [Ornithinibacillus salinisoli]|uniref:M20/M25/M40 family metallo-hydrolase n=1 Tax=Ornithinibacillus salinisoli TaxID=1848459 RepID=A0ABW4W0Q8_9BACI